MMPESVRARRHVRYAVALSAAALLLVALQACSSSKDRAGSGGNTSFEVDGSPVATAAACVDGDVRSCSVTISADGRELSCYDGVQTCARRHWGPCSDGEVVSREAPSAWVAPTSTGWLSLTWPEACGATNPCNPDCMRYQESDPVGPLVPDGVPPHGLRGGPITSAPAQSDCSWGNDCQYNFFCDAPLTASQCPHSKCVADDAPLGSCVDSDPCVEAICAENESCCTTEWSHDCVDMVKTVCDAFCSEELFDECSHHVCVEGEPLACRSPCVLAICEQNPDCCDSSWDESCVALTTTLDACSPIQPNPAVAVPSLSSLSDLCSYAIYASNNLTIGQETRARGRIGAGGDVRITGATLNQVELTVGGNLSLDNATVTGSAQVSGNVQFVNAAELQTWLTEPVLVAGGSISLPNNNSVLEGDVVSPRVPVASGTTPAAPPQWVGNHTVESGPVQTPHPTIDVTAPAECGQTPTYPVAVDNVYDLPPNQHYGALTVNGNQRLVLHSGSYIFESLTLNSDALVQMTYAPDGIDLHICSGLAVQPHVWFSPTPAEFTELRWFYYGQSTFTLDLQNRFWDDWDDERMMPGVIVAPNATVNVQPHTSLFGVIYAKNLTIEPGLYHLPIGYRAQMCAATDAPICNAGLPLSPAPVETGACVPWEIAAEDPSCDGFDLSLGIPCAESILVCNHGQHEAPAGVELALFTPDYPLGTLTPVADESNPQYVGTCLTTAPIAAGSCINQTCESGLLNTALNVLAVAPSGSTECGDLENWTTYKPETECECLPSRIAASDIDGDSCLIVFNEIESADVTTMSWEHQGGTETALTRVGSSDDCTGTGEQWYVDTWAVVLCPDACSAVVAEAESFVYGVGDCVGTPYTTTVLPAEPYWGDCSDEQNADTAPQWDLLTWRATTPGNSSVTFEIRTSIADNDDGDWIDSEWRLVGTASSAKDAAGLTTEWCDLFSNHEDCPAVLPLLANEGDWEQSELRHEFLQLRITLNPDPENPRIFPELSWWNLQYSCIDSQ